MIKHFNNASIQYPHSQSYELRQLMMFLAS